MKPGTISLTKDIEWKIDDKKYVVKNVPYSVLPAEDMKVSIRLTMLCDLMDMNEIPSVGD